jgi:DNA-binding response OmpR family regulator
MSFQIIVLEDQEIVSTLVVNALQRAGYAALSVSMPQEALAALRRHGGISLLVADVLLGPASGVQTALTAVSLQPSLNVLFTSGTPMKFWTGEDLDGVCALPHGSFAFLMKPFQAGELLTAVEALLRPSIPHIGAVPQLDNKIGRGGEGFP